MSNDGKKGNATVMRNGVEVGSVDLDENWRCLAMSVAHGKQQWNALMQTLDHVSGHLPVAAKWIFEHAPDSALADAMRARKLSNDELEELSKKMAAEKDNVATIDAEVAMREAIVYSAFVELPAPERVRILDELEEKGVGNAFCH